MACHLFSAKPLLLNGSLEQISVKLESKYNKFSCKKMHLKILSAKWLTFCLSLNVLPCCLDNLPISFKVTSQVLGQMYDCPSSQQWSNLEEHVWGNKSESCSKNYNTVQTKQNRAQQNHVRIVWDTDGSVQDCSISSALALEILQSCTKPSTYTVLGICQCMNERNGIWPHANSKALCLYCVLYVHLSYVML